MSSLRSAQRVVRASATSLRPATAASAGNQRVWFHETSKAKAVEAVVSQTPIFDMLPPSASVCGGPGPHPSLQHHRLLEPFPQLEGFTQLNIKEQAFSPKFYEAVGKIMKLREKYVRDRSIFLDGDEVLSLVLGLGANEADVPKLKQVSDNLRSDPTLTMRVTRSCRFCIDLDTKTARRLEFQPFKLSPEEDFQRHDARQLRFFDEVENQLQLNSVLQALLAFKAMMIHGVEIARRPKLQYGANKWVSTLFNLRTITTPAELGELASEGVHSDGVDHTMTTYLGSRNMSAGSAATFMHDMAETTGNPVKEVKPEHLLARVQHKRFLDTLLLVDHERKHSVSAVYPADDSQEATRDMLLFFTRKPPDKTHPSGAIDSLKPHKTLPMELPIFLPGDF